MKIMNIFIFIIGIVFFIPLSYLIPKNKKLFLIIGKNGKFIDNTKYLFLYINQTKTPQDKIFFITKDKEVYNQLKEFKFPVLKYPSFSSVIALLRANYTIIDDTSSIKILKYYMGFRSKTIQLWHGLGFKKIEIEKFAYESQEFNFLKKILYEIINKLCGRFPKYEYVISTSKFYTKRFLKSFESKYIIETGIPRNDIFFREFNKYIMFGADQEKLSKITELKTAGKKIVLYVPTFRDSGSNAIKEGILNLSELSRFAETNDIIFILKFHNISRLNYDLDDYKNIMVYDNDKDVQPLLYQADILITDYSSIFMDYLLLNRPIIYFPYDYEEYTIKDRALVFDYDFITPGPKSYNQEDLEKRILEAIEDPNLYSDERNKIKKITFKYEDGQSSERIWNHLKSE
jgi:CDP-glycerol glycerophosphotransferase (TagB/SpsB family)